MSSGTSVFPLTLAERVVLVVLVLAVVTLLLVFPGVVTLVSLAISLFVVWLLWRLVQATERIAEATERLAQVQAPAEDD